MNWTYKDFVKDALTRVPEVSCEDAGKHADAVLLDVREGDEIAAGVLGGAVLLPRGLVEKHVGEHIANKDTPVIV